MPTPVKDRVERAGLAAAVAGLASLGWWVGHTIGAVTLGLLALAAVLILAGNA